MTFNTGNPIGSTDARDLSDNAENFDKALGTLDATWVDRLGVTRDSFEGRLAKGSFYRVGDFTTGYTLTNMRQTLEYSGHEYSWAGAFPKVVAAGATPATSGGIGAGAWVDRTDLTLRSEINVVVKQFASVADMVADASLTIGQKVEWLGYYQPFDGGGNKGVVVASGTGTDDGGSYFDCDSGVQVKAIINGYVTPEMWGGAADWNGTTGTDSYAAWSAAISYAKTNYPTTIIPDSGCYYSSQNWPVIDEPIAIVGNHNTFIQFAPNVGQAVTVRNCGFNDESVFFGKTADRAFTHFSDVKLPVKISGISLLGDRSVSGAQHGIVFEGNNDYVHLDVECWYFNGRGAWFGKSYSGDRGNIREFSKCRVRTRLCGRTDSTASVTFEVANATVKDSSNLIKPLDIECVFPFGNGVEFVDNRVDSTGSGLYGFIGDVMVHGPNFTSQNGTLLRFVGRVTDVNLRTNIAYDESDNKSISFDKNYTNNEYPRNINLSVTAPSSNKVFEFKHGASINIDYIGGYSRKELGEVGSNFEGPLTINVYSNGHLLAHAASFTINSTTPVSLTSWAGGYLGVTGFPTFFRLQSATGDGDTIRATVRGIIGVITRTGNATTGSDTYTFTADSAPSGFVVPANSKFSKFVVSSSKQVLVSGRYLGPEVMQHGLQSPAEYNADGKLKIGFYSIWNQGTLLRKKYGEPTSSTDGEAIGQWYKVFVGASSTPSVTGASMLYANYASPTNLTDMTNGIDGQRVSIVAENANCTIVNGPTILTNSGANISLAAGKAVSFIYSSGLSAWVQC